MAGDLAGEARGGGAFASCGLECFLSDPISNTPPASSKHPRETRRFTAALSGISILGPVQDKYIPLPPAWIMRIRARQGFGMARMAAAATSQRRGALGLST